MRTVRALLLLLGLAALANGARLLHPQLDTTLLWLVGGPLVHDALVAPLVWVTGLVLGRLVADPTRRGWIRAGLVTTATLVLISVPLLWRPPDAPPNPGLPDRNYPLGLIGSLVAVWAVTLTASLVAKPVARRRLASAAPGERTDEP